MAIRRRTWAGLPTSWGQDWGRIVSFGSMTSGGRFYRLDGSSPDDSVGLIWYCHGYGGDAETDMARLASTVYRAAHRGDGYHVVGWRGTFTDSGSNRTTFGPNGLLPRQTSFPWVASTLYAAGDRRTADGRTYYCTAGGTSANPAPSGSGTAPLHQVIDGGGVAWRCVSLGTDDRDIPDVDCAAGVGRTVSGIFRPEGVLRTILRTSGINFDRRRIYVGGYSTGGGLAHALLANHSDVICGAWDFAGCGFSSPSDINYAAPARRRKRLHIHGSTDGTVNVLEVPPASSSAAVSPHPSAVRTVEDHMHVSGHDGSVVLVDTGVRIDFDATPAGAETEVHAPPSDVLDEEGNPVPMRYYRVVGQGHVPNTNNEGHRQVTRFLDENPGAL